jgi:hypothetical protein
MRDLENLKNELELRKTEKVNGVIGVSADRGTTYSKGFRELRPHGR